MTVQVPVTSAPLVPAPLTQVAIEPLEVTIVSNVDSLSEGNVCSCAAGDDNPF